MGMSDTSRPIVIASNRGPVTYQLVVDDGATRIVARRGSGGLVSGLKPLLDSGDARWVSAAMTDGDRAAAEAGADGPLGDEPVELVTMSQHELDCYYDTISNETLWFVHHGLYDLVRSPDFDDAWWEAWRVYETINHRFAERIAECAPTDAIVLIQDYHLSLVASTLRELREDLALVHFSHTPFAGPDNLRVLPGPARTTLLRGMASHDACGFHTTMWARNFTQCMEAFEVSATSGTTAGTPSARPSVFASTLSSDLGDIRATAASGACTDELARIDGTFTDKQLVVRVDRMELSKNIVRGFRAFDLLLERRPDLRGRVEFLARCYPSRESVDAYRRYRDEVIASAEAVNERWGTTEWCPIHLETDDNYDRSVAALRRYDVLVVNPIRDGLNLVAKEGPAINERSGQLVLSDQAGAWTEMGTASFTVDPFDLSSTATALADALDISGAERSDRARELNRLATARTPSDWLDDQIAAVGRPEL